MPNRFKSHKPPGQGHKPHGNQANARRLRSSVRWQKFRAWFIKRNPLCCNPFNDPDHQEKATEEIHHIEQVAERPELLCDEENCAGLCKACHQRIEAQERAGKRTRGMFEKDYILTVENTSKLGKPIKVFDANGKELEQLIRANIQTGEIEAYALRDGYPYTVNGIELATEVSFVPSPLRVEYIEGGNQWTLT